jgi:hypothetical protein
LPGPPPPPPSTSTGIIKQEEDAAGTEGGAEQGQGAAALLGGSVNGEVAGDQAIKAEDAEMTQSVKSDEQQPGQQQQQDEHTLKPAVMDAASLDAEIAAVAAAAIPSDPTLLLRGRHTKEDRVR